MSAERTRELLDIVGAPPTPSSAAARTVMRGNRRKDSTPELALRSALHSIGLRFRVDYPIRVAGLRPVRPDVVFTRRHLAVFVDGCFWHGCPAHGRRPSTNSRYWNAKIELNQDRDRRQTEALTDDGWTVVRIWEHDVGSIGLNRVLEAYAASAGT